MYYGSGFLPGDSGSGTVARFPPPTRWRLHEDRFARCQGVANFLRLCKDLHDREHFAGSTISGFLAKAESLSTFVAKELTLCKALT